MLKANSAPDKADGAQAFWVDGELYGHFDGFRWRTTDKLKINSFWLLYYNTEQPARHNNDPHPESRVMEVWFDDIVIATEYIGPVQGRPAGGRKKARPSYSALLTPGALVPEPGAKAFSADFESGDGGFAGGQVVDASGGDSKAYAFGPAGASVWNRFSVPVAESTTVRLRLKALGETRQATILIWSKNGDNCRYEIGSLPGGVWRTWSSGRWSPAGWGMKGGLEGDVLNNFKIIYERRTSRAADDFIPEELLCAEAATIGRRGKPRPCNLTED